LPAGSSAPQHTKPGRPEKLVTLSQGEQRTSGSMAERTRRPGTGTRRVGKHASHPSIRPVHDSLSHRVAPAPLYPSCRRRPSLRVLLGRRAAPDHPLGLRDGTGQSEDEAEASPPRYATAAGGRPRVSCGDNKEAAQRAGPSVLPSTRPIPMHAPRSPAGRRSQKSHGSFPSLPPSAWSSPSVCMQWYRRVSFLSLCCYRCFTPFGSASSTLNSINVASAVMYQYLYE
jgi:hypothetical protein